MHDTTVLESSWTQVFFQRHCKASWKGEGEHQSTLEGNILLHLGAKLQWRPLLVDSLVSFVSLGLGIH